MTVEQRLDDEPQEREDREVENVNDLTEVFLNELTSMSLRYGLVISGCGCCDSPSIDVEKERGHYVYTHRLEWKKSDPPTPMVKHPLRHVYCGTDEVCSMCGQPFDEHQ